MSEVKTSQIKKARILANIATLYEEHGDYIKAANKWLEVEKASPVYAKVNNTNDKAFDCYLQFYKENLFLFNHNFVNFGEILYLGNVFRLKKQDFRNLAIANQKIKQNLIESGHNELANSISKEENEIYPSGHHYLGELETLEKVLKAMESIDKNKFEKCGENISREPIKDIAIISSLIQNQYSSIKKVKNTFNQYYNYRYTNQFDIDVLAEIYNYTTSNSTNSEIKEIQEQCKEIINDIQNKKEIYNEFAQKMQTIQIIPEFSDFLCCLEKSQFTLDELEADGFKIGSKSYEEFYKQGISSFKDGELTESQIAIEKANIESGGKYKSEIAKLNNIKQEENSQIQFEKIEEFKEQFIKEQYNSSQSYM